MTHATLGRLAEGASDAHRIAMALSMIRVYLEVIDDTPRPEGLAGARMDVEERRLMDLKQVLDGTR